MLLDDARDAGVRVRGQKLFVCACLLVACLAIVRPANAETSEGWDVDKEELGNLIDSGDCGTAWDITWYWAKKGIYEARGSLAFGFYSANLVPPGLNSPRRDIYSRKAWLYNFVVLSIHGIPVSNPQQSEIMRQTLDSDLLEEVGLSSKMGQAFKDCLVAKKQNSEECLAEAIEAGFVPSFEDYARDLERKASRPGAQPAFCLPGRTD